MASAWEIKGIPTFDLLTGDSTAEVCIVGGGLAGMWCAYLLTKSGKHVVVLEKDRVGRAATLYTTAFLTQYIDTGLTDLVAIFGKAKAKAIWQAHGEAIDLIEEVVKIEAIDCEFMRTDNMILATDEKELEGLEEEHTMAEKLGFPSAIKKTRFKGFRNIGGQVLKRQGKYHPMKFFQGLAEAATRYGAEIYENTEVTEITGRTAFAIKTKSSRIIRAKHVVVTTYDPFNNPKPVHLKKGMYETYVYEIEMKRGSLPEGIYEDDKNPYHYFRVDRGEKVDRVIVGGEDHRAELLKALEKKSFKALRQWIDTTFDGLDYKVVRRWHGGILEPSDGIALIGEYAPRRYLAAAFSGNGMTYSALSGSIIRDLILGKKNQYAAIFDPKRKLDRKALLYKFRDYGEEMIRGAGKNIFE